MATSRSCVTSCSISAIGKSGARSSGPRGFSVPGWSTGGSGFGRSAWMLYHRAGRRDSSSTYFTGSVMAALRGSGAGRREQSTLGGDSAAVAGAGVRASGLGSVAHGRSKLLDRRKGAVAGEEGGLGVVRRGHRLELDADRPGRPAHAYIVCVVAERRV